MPRKRSKDKDKSGDHSTAAELVRPGGLMQVLHAFMGEFAEKKKVPDEMRVSQIVVRKQLTNIRADCLHVVEDMGRGKV